MTEFLVDNIYVRFGGQLFRQTIGIPMGTKCAPLLADLFLYPYENKFLDKFIKEGIRNSSLIFTPKNSPFLRLQSLLYLLLILTYFLLEMRTTTLPPNHMTNVMCLVSFYVTQYSISSSLQCLCLSVHSLCPLFKL